MPGWVALCCFSWCSEAGRICHRRLLLNPSRGCPKHGCPGEELTFALGPPVGEEEHEQSKEHKDHRGPVLDGNSRPIFYGERPEVGACCQQKGLRVTGRGLQDPPGHLVAQPQATSRPFPMGLTGLVPQAARLRWCGDGGGVPGQRWGRGGHRPRLHPIHVPCGRGGVSHSLWVVIVLGDVLVPQLLSFEGECWAQGSLIPARAGQPPRHQHRTSKY